MLSTLNVRADKHNSCEDSIYVYESESFIDGIISDGCSSGINSHFASQAMCYAFSKHKYDAPFTDEAIIYAVKENMRAIIAELDLNHEHMLATAILFHYNKLDKTLYIRVLGDGYYYINDKSFVVDQNNTPDYMGYHLEEDVTSFNEYLSKYPEMIYDNVDKFMICSDGITRIERSALQKEATIDPDHLLFVEPSNGTYLKRMWNLIKRDGYMLSDDLSIVSFTHDDPTNTISYDNKES